MKPVKMVSNIINHAIYIFNETVLFCFNYAYILCKIENIEDRYHREKKNNNNFMNKVKLEFVHENELDIVKNNVMNVIQNHLFLDKYEITTESILHKTNNKLFVEFNTNNICVYFNHYYISGSTMFILLNKIVNGTPPKFLKTNPFYGIIYLPLYIYKMMLLKKKQYTKTEKQNMHFIVEKNIDTKNKRFCVYLNILEKVYTSLQMTTPMSVALTMAFDELPYVNNNVGVIIIEYSPTDTVETLEKKIKNELYQVYVSNFLLNLPVPSFNIGINMWGGSIELREYVDCIISSMYIKSDFDFTIGWDCCKPVVEQMYVGSVSILHSNNTIDIDMVFNTSSSNYIQTQPYIENYFK